MIAVGKDQEELDASIGYYLPDLKEGKIILIIPCIRPNLWYFQKKGTIYPMIACAIKERDMYMEIPIAAVNHHTETILKPETKNCELCKQGALDKFCTNCGLVSCRECTPLNDKTKCPGCKFTGLEILRLWSQKQYHNPKTLSCNACGEPPKNMLWCSQCSSTIYCSKECQKEDWPNHKQRCSKFG